MARSKEEKTPGYTLQAVHLWDGKRLHHSELLLPDTMVEEVDLWNLRALQAREEAEAEQYAKRNADSLEDADTRMVSPAGKSRTAVSSSKKEQDLQAKKASLLKRFEADSKSLQASDDPQAIGRERVGPRAPDRVQVFEFDEPLKLLRRPPGFE